MKTELLPCPFCGEKARIRREKYWMPKIAFNIICTKCYSSGGWYKTDQEAIEKWNRRVCGSLELLAARIEDTFVDSYKYDDDFEAKIDQTLMDETGYKYDGYFLENREGRRSD